MTTKLLITTEDYPSWGSRSKKSIKLFFTDLPIFFLLLFQIGWLKADTKAIQAIGKHVISNNDRISVSHDETRAKFRLHITNVTLEDAGPYMCQINSMPVKLQVSAKCFSIIFFKCSLWNEGSLISGGIFKLVSASEFF